MSLARIRPTKVDVYNEEDILVGRMEREESGWSLHSVVKDPPRFLRRLSLRRGAARLLEFWEKDQRPTVFEVGEKK